MLLSSELLVITFNSLQSNFNVAAITRGVLLVLFSPFKKTILMTHLHLSMGPSFSATLNKMSAVQNSGIRTNNFPASAGNWKPNLCSNNMNGWYNKILFCSAFHGTTGTDCFFTENPENKKIEFRISETVIVFSSRLNVITNAMIWDWLDDRNSGVVIVFRVRSMSVVDGAQFGKATFNQ